MQSAFTTLGEWMKTAIKLVHTTTIQTESLWI
jgi:hypothetical protein